MDGNPVNPDDVGNPPVSDASGLGSETGGAGDDGLVIIDPTTGSRGSDGGSASSGTGFGNRRRGRPPGSGKASGKAALDGIDVREILVSIHGLLATRFGEHWTIDNDEAKQIESAIKRTMRHQEMQVSQKAIDYGFAVYVVAMVYGTRLAAQFMGPKKEAQENEMVSSAPVFQFPQPGSR